LHLLFEGPESLFDIVIANEYLQNVSNRGGIPEVSDNNAKLEYRGCTRLSQGVQRREVIEIKGRAPLDNRADRAHRHVIIGHNT